MGATISSTKESLPSNSLVIELPASGAVTVHSSSTSSTANSNADGSTASPMPANNSTSSTRTVTAISSIVSEVSISVATTSLVCDDGPISGMQNHGQYCTAAVTSSFPSTTESSHPSTFPTAPYVSQPPIQPAPTASPPSSSLEQTPSHVDEGPTPVPASNDPDKSATGDNSPSSFLTDPGKDSESSAALITGSQSEASTGNALPSSVVHSLGISTGGDAVSTTTHEGVGAELNPAPQASSEATLSNPATGDSISSHTGSIGVEVSSTSSPPGLGGNPPYPASETLIASLSAGGETVPFSWSHQTDQAVTSSATEASPLYTSVGGGVASTNVAGIAEGPDQELSQSSSTASPNAGVGGISAQSLASGPAASSDAGAVRTTVRSSADPDISHGSSSGVPDDSGSTDGRPSTGGGSGSVRTASLLVTTRPPVLHGATSGGNTEPDSHKSGNEGSEPGAGEVEYTAEQIETGGAILTTSSGEQAISLAFYSSTGALVSSQAHTLGAQATNLAISSSIGSHDPGVVANPAESAPSSSTGFNPSVVDFATAGQTAATQLQSIVLVIGNTISAAYSSVTLNGKATVSSPYGRVSGSTSPELSGLTHNVAGGASVATTIQAGTYTTDAVTPSQVRFKTPTSTFTTLGSTSSISSGNILDTSISPTPMPSLPAILSSSGQQATTYRDSDGGVVIGSATLSPGELITLSGPSNSFASSEIIVKSSTIIFSTSVNLDAAAQSAQVEAIFTIHGHTYTADEVAGRSDLVVIDGTTLLPGGQALTVDGEILTLGPAGLEAESATNSRVLIPLTSAILKPASTLHSTNIEVTTYSVPFPTTSAPEPEAVFTVDGHVYTAYAISGQSREVLINGTTLSMGGAPLTLDDEQVSLDAHGGLEFASAARSGRTIAFSTMVFTVAETTTGAGLDLGKVSTAPGVSSSGASVPIDGTGSATPASSTTKSRGGKVKPAVLLCAGCVLSMLTTLC
ncbi:MAG: hypothetical protein Q9165_005513 [Trypethelium subeluteriae]